MPRGRSLETVGGQLDPVFEVERQEGQPFDELLLELSELGRADLRIGGRPGCRECWRARKPPPIANAYCACRPPPAPAIRVPRVDLTVRIGSRGQEVPVVTVPKAAIP